ncbi:hypothetical protein C4N9_18825 [Pararhodobacter marinus]|uniref:Uncharacterized protein n=1 Tax=Pararhodobacter marinus TaxID=2184063 RepID=A0A2U2C5A1_9RHOB|nr:hypothetical protein C4N9_18825 [Pararhodobacter marinus]
MAAPGSACDIAAKSLSETIATSVTSGIIEWSGAAKISNTMIHTISPPCSRAETFCPVFI